MPNDVKRNLDRRAMLGAGIGLVAAGALGVSTTADAKGRTVEQFTAKPPPGFSPLAKPGLVVKVEERGDFASMMQPNLLWPKPEVAKKLLERALTEFTGAPDLKSALGKFVHKDDIVALKVNGIAGQKGYTMAFNFELTRPLVDGLIALGIPPKNITVFEQRISFLRGARIGVKGYDLPEGVQTGFHNNEDTEMPRVAIYEGIPTKFVRYLTRATAVLDLTMIKDHSICGYTGTLKNMTHGQITNPHDHHAHHCNPQIAMLYNHPVLKSRVRLHITDAFKITYEGGPLDKYPERRVPHGAVYVATDPVAMDTIGWGVVEAARKANGLPALKQAGREPAYIRTAAELGLGIYDLNRIRLQSVTA